MSGRDCFKGTKTQSTKISGCFALTGQEYSARFPIVFKQAGLQERPKQDLETFCSKDNFATLYLNHWINHLNVMLKCPYKGGILEKYDPWNMWSELCPSAPHPLQSTGLNHHHFHLNLIVPPCQLRGFWLFWDMWIHLTTNSSLRYAFILVRFYFHSPGITFQSCFWKSETTLCICWPSCPRNVPFWSLADGGLRETRELRNPAPLAPVGGCRTHTHSGAGTHSAAHTHTAGAGTGADSRTEEHTRRPPPVQDIFPNQNYDGARDDGNIIMWFYANVFTCDGMTATINQS